MKPSNRARAKQRATLDTRAQLSWTLLTERGAQCEACAKTPVGATPPRLWTDKHEVLSRGRGGSPVDPENILCLCRECHAFITTNPEWAEATGMSRANTAEEHQRKYRPWEVTGESDSKP